MHSHIQNFFFWNYIAGNKAKGFSICSFTAIYWTPNINYHHFVFRKIPSPIHPQTRKNHATIRYMPCSLLFRFTHTQTAALYGGPRDISHPAFCDTPPSFFSSLHSGGNVKDNGSFNSIFLHEPPDFLVISFNPSGNGNVIFQGKGVILLR